MTLLVPDNLAASDVKLVTVHVYRVVYESVEDAELVIADTPRVAVAIAKKLHGPCRCAGIPKYVRSWTGPENFVAEALDDLSPVTPERLREGR